MIEHAIVFVIVAVATAYAAWRVLPGGVRQGLAGSLARWMQRHGQWSAAERLQMHLTGKACGACDSCGGCNDAGTPAEHATSNAVRIPERGSWRREPPFDSHSGESPHESSPCRIRFRIFPGRCRCLGAEHAAVRSTDRSNRRHCQSGGYRRGAAGQIEVAEQGGKGLRATHDHGSHRRRTSRQRISCARA